ncbi:MAG: hypothetical protein OHK0017_08040 [Patescibacteria group bacterium]
MTQELPLHIQLTNAGIDCDYEGAARFRGFFSVLNEVDQRVRIVEFGLQIAIMILTTD